MDKKRPFKMPRVPSPDGHDSNQIYYRLNPSGHVEQVVSKKGKLDDETLNELAIQINSMLEDIEMAGTAALSAETTDPYRSFPQMVGNRGDSIRNLGDTISNMTGSTPLAGELDETPEGKRANMYNNDDPEDKHNPAAIVGIDAESVPKKQVQMESFTGTAGIAIAPMCGTMNIDKAKRKKSSRLSIVKPNGTWEHHMRSEIDKLLVEWEPEFVAGEYDPGEHTMDNLGGEGLAGRKAKAARGAAEGMKNHGEPFGAEHNETPAMCDVEESGVEDKPQGDHESSVGDPLADDCCDEVGHNWPDQPRHKGGGVAEPMAGNRYSNGGVLHGSQMEWSPSKIGKLMGEDADLQSLFDNYARKTKFVHLDGFGALCEAHGLDVSLDSSSLLGLMAVNRDYVFHEHEDADGVYYLKTPIIENDEFGMDELGTEESDIGSDGDEGYADEADEDDIESTPHTVTIDGVDYVPADQTEESGPPEPTDSADGYDDLDSGFDDGMGEDSVIDAEDEMMDNEGGCY